MHFRPACRILASMRPWLSLLLAFFALGCTELGGYATAPGEVYSGEVFGSDEAESFISASSAWMKRSCASVAGVWARSARLSRRKPS